MDKNLETVLKYLIYFFPPLLMTGPFLPDLNLSISVIFFIFLILKRNELYLFNNFYFKVYLVFLLYIILRSFLTLEFLSIKPSLFYFRFGFYSLLIFYFLKKNILNLKLFCFIILLTLITLYIDANIQLFTGENIFGNKMFHHERVSSFFGDELIMGGASFRIFTFIIAILFFLNLKKKISLSLSFLIFFMILSLILYSSERTAVALFFMFSIVFFIFIPIKLNFKIFLTAILSLLIIIFFYLNDASRNRIIKKSIDEINLNVAYNNLLFSTVHASSMLTGMEMFKDNILFGKGPKMYRKVCDDENFQKYKVGDYSCTTHPHNIIVQILAETGIIGLIFLLIFYFKLIQIFFNSIFTKHKQEHRFSIIVLSSLLILNFFPFLPSGNIFNNWLSIISYLPIPFLMFISSNSVNTNK